MKNSVSLAIYSLVTFAVFNAPSSYNVTAHAGDIADKSTSPQNKHNKINEINPHRLKIGKRLFNLDWKSFPGPKPHEDGLGPYFNRVSCSGCHAKLGRGRPPEVSFEPFTSMILRSGVIKDGKTALHPHFGKQIQDRAIPPLDPEAQPRIQWKLRDGHYSDGTIYQLRYPEYQLKGYKTSNEVKNQFFSGRVAQPLFGIGLLDAISEKSLENISDPKDKNNDGISGRINWINQPDGTQKAGRFGWKASQTDLIHQTAAALSQDMGLTNPLFPLQNCDLSDQACMNAPAEEGLEITESQLDFLVAFQRHIPTYKSVKNPEKPLTQADLTRGKQLFTDLQCASCHIPNWQLDQPVKLHKMALFDQRQYDKDSQLIEEVTNFAPYTDLLLHDMGPNLSEYDLTEHGFNDAQASGQANGQEWRTAPLWGIAQRQPLRLLHDGRARSIAEAILWHGGEAEKAKEGFRTLSATDRTALINFVNSL